MKRFFAAGLCLLLLLATGCKKQMPGKSDLISLFDNTPSVDETVDKGLINPLTGLSGLAEDMQGKRPMAIMINNLKQAQRFQCGLNHADIIYETEVEGGISRIMAVYQDVRKAKQIGSIRSARYVYIDLALGHDAIYLYHGQDPTYAKPHLADIDNITVDDTKYGSRIANGLASEHTLYTFGEKLYNAVQSSGKRLTTERTEPWQDFADEDEKVTLSDGTCTSISVPFSTSYVTGFTYDSASGLYTRLYNGNIVKDYITGESTQVKNVFVLLTDIPFYSNDNEHRNVHLQGGKGYYVTNGTYTQIKWTKGSSKNAFAFTDVNGNKLKVSAGNSYVCITDQSRNTPSFQ